MRYAVILAGGSGTRLWLWSRLQLPKQLILRSASARILARMPDGASFLSSAAILSWNRRKIGITFLRPFPKACGQPSPPLLVLWNHPNCAKEEDSCFSRCITSCMTYLRRISLPCFPLWKMPNFQIAPLGGAYEAAGHRDRLGIRNGGGRVNLLEESGKRSFLQASQVHASRIRDVTPCH